MNLITSLLIHLLFYIITSSFLTMASSGSSSSSFRVVIVPGNGCANVKKSNWYDFMAQKLAKTGLFSEVVLTDMPDPYEAKEKVWVPFLLGHCKADEHTILIGHSSGAEATMRLLEDNRLLGAVLVSACHTDLGIASETISGYYSRPWEWDRMKANAGVFGILQFHSEDDPFIRIEEADYVARHIGSEYHKFEDRSHFFDTESVEDVFELIVSKVQTMKERPL